MLLGIAVLLAGAADTSVQFAGLAGPVGAPGAQRVQTLASQNSAFTGPGELLGHQPIETARRALRPREDIQRVGGMEALDVPYMQTGFPSWPVRVTPSPAALYVILALLGAGPGLYLDLSAFSLQVPIAGSVAESRTGEINAKAAAMKRTERAGAAAGAVYLRHRRVPGAMKPGIAVTVVFWCAAVLITLVMAYYVLLSMFRPLL